MLVESGPPTEENHSAGIAIYRKGPLKIDVAYESGIAKKLIVTSIDVLPEEAIRAILALNSNGLSWHEIPISGGTRVWQRSDLAQAECDRLKPRTVTIVRGRATQSPLGVAPPVNAPQLPSSTIGSSTAVTSKSKTVRASGGKRSRGLDGFCRTRYRTGEDVPDAPQTLCVCTT